MLRVGLLPIELHEDKIPDLQEAVILRLQPGDDIVVSLVRIFVPVNFRIGAAGAGVRHLPKIG